MNSFKKHTKKMKNSSISTASNSIEEFCNQIAALRNEYEDTILKVNTANKLFQKNQEALIQTEQLVKEYSDENDALTETVATLEHRLVDVQVEYDVKQTQFQQLNTKYESMENELRIAQEQVDSVMYVDNIFVV